MDHLLLKLCLACALFLVIFFFFGGSLLFDLDRRLYRAALAIAFPMALIIFLFIRQDEKIENLENRLKDLEKRLKEPGSS